MARLVVITQALAGLAHELGEGWTTIGRVDESAFKIVDTSVSAQHCEVQLQGEALSVRDLCSTNGTFVQGRRINEAVLKAGQTFRVGEVDLRFEAPAVKASPAPSFVNTMMVGAKSPKTGLSPEAEAGNAPVAREVPAKKYRVLFVDDSLAFIETFTELCSVLSNQTWEIHSAASVDQALAVLQRNPMNLVVLDVVMPMVDGLQVLGIIKRRYPGVRIAVLTGRATEINRAACLTGGGELFIEKPVSADGCKIVFNMLNELASWGHGEGFSGALHQVGLQEVIQMECIGRRSLILEVRNHELLGDIYIETGAITHASVGTLAGVNAFNQLLAMTGGEFRMKPFEKPPQRTVDAPWEYLLMEAARCRDEGTDLLERAAADSLKSETTIQAIASDLLPAPEKEPTELEEDFVVIATYDGEWTPVNGSEKPLEQAPRDL